MTSKSDSTSHPRPPTIDLTAKEVAPERPAGPEAPSEETSAPSPSAESAAGSSHSHIASALAGGVAGAIAIAAIIVALQATGHWPLGENSAPPAAEVPAASNDAAIADVTAQLNKIQGALAAQQPDPTLVPRLAAADAATKSLSNSVATLGTQSSIRSLAPLKSHRFRPSPRLIPPTPRRVQRRVVSRMVISTR